MSEQFIRTEMLLGREAVLKLARVRVAVFGVGGVGGYAVGDMPRIERNVLLKAWMLEKPHRKAASVILHFSLTIIFCAMSMR